jgi:NAD(P)-dependent dehydrogenase (short-subunit alcohol dehydrogenase family)
MTQSDRGPQSFIQDVALIVGGGPGISSSCARLFAKSGMRVGIAARNPDKAVLLNLEIAGCEFQAPQKCRRLIMVYAISFIP